MGAQSHRGDLFLSRRNFTAPNMPFGAVRATENTILLIFISKIFVKYA